MSASRTPGITAPLGDVIAVAVVVLFAVLPFPEDDFRVRGSLIVVALLPAAAMPLRRRWPLIALGISILCAVAIAFTGVVSPGALLAAAISAFAVAAGRTRAVSIPAVATAALIVFLSNGLALEGELFDSRAMQFLLMLVLAGAVGDATRSRREYGAAMTERAERAEQGREEEARRRVAEERVRIARDLHDVVAHQIAVISLSAGVASSALETRPERAREALTTIRGASRTVLADIGGLMAVLRSDEGDSAMGLRPQAGLADLDTLLAEFRDVGLHVRSEGDVSARALSPASDRVAYLVIQEGLTNAHKHGSGHEALLRLRLSDGALVLTLTNSIDDVDTADPPSGHGLRGLRERAAAVRGVVDVKARDGRFRLDVRIPAEGGDA